jgi:multidrug efflux pump subunit AcrA (membrane-fusion protein)
MALCSDIADIRTVWVQAQLYEDDLAFLPKGTHDPTSGVAEKLQAGESPPSPAVFLKGLCRSSSRISTRSRTLAVRFVLDNENHELRPGMTATVRLHLDAKTIAELPIGKQLKMLDGKVLAVAERSVIDTGDKKIVFRETVPTQYEGVEVTLGPRMTGPGGEVYHPILDHSLE